MAPSTATMTMTPLAREYLRVSKDDSGRARSLDEQLADNRQRWAGELTLNGDSYSDESIPASRFSTRNRGSYDALVSDLAAGRFGADVLVLWESSRGSRRAGEWCDLIDLCQQTGVRIAVTTHGRIYDADNNRDRRTLQEDAIDAEYESGKISDRTRRAMSANAAEGRPHGRVPFGYRRRYDLQTHKLIAQEPDPATAPIVRELFDRLRKGHSLKAIARDFRDRGLTNASGRPFSAQHLRVMATNEVYNGQREHHGKLTEATWPALVDEVTYSDVRRMFADRKVGSARSGRAVHWLSGIARCALCDGTLSAERRGGRWIYRDRHVTIDRDAFDAVAEAVMLDYLAEPVRFERAQRLNADGDDVLDQARAEVARIRAELAELYAEVEAGDVSATIATRREAGILKALELAEARVRELATPSRLRGLIDPGPEIEDRWAAAPVSAKRDIARILASPTYLGELVVHKATTRGDITDRVEWRRLDVS